MHYMLVPALGYPLFFLFGLALGSFGNVVAYRLPVRKSLGGRSHCPNCGRTLGILDLFPVLSWLFLRAKCRSCSRPISIQYPLVELAVALLFTGAAAYSSFDLLPSVFLGFVFWSMFLITLIDLRTQLIPDLLSLTLAVSGVAYTWSLYGTFTFTGAIAGLLFMGTLWGVSRGRWTGSGDVLLAGAIGLFLGHWPYMILSLMISYIIGAFISLGLLIARKAGPNTHISFGPFLIAGALISFFFGEAIFRMVFPY